MSPLIVIVTFGGSTISHCTLGVCVCVCVKIIVDERYGRALVVHPGRQRHPADIAVCMKLRLDTD